MRSTLMPRIKPAPPKICTASEAQNAMVCVAWFFNMQISATGFSPWSSRHASISSIACDAAARRTAPARQGQPLAIEILHDDLESPALFADQVLRGDAAVVEIERCGVRGS